MNRVRLALKRIWHWLREVTGDAAYENYARRCELSSRAKRMTRSEFYSDTLRRKYSTINRCC